MSRKHGGRPLYGWSTQQQGGFRSPSPIRFVKADGKGALVKKNKLKELGEALERSFGHASLQKDSSEPKIEGPALEITDSTAQLTTKTNRVQSTTVVWMYSEAHGWRVFDKAWPGFDARDPEKMWWISNPAKNFSFAKVNRVLLDKYNFKIISKSKIDDENRRLLGEFKKDFHSRENEIREKFWKEYSSDEKFDEKDYYQNCYSCRKILSNRKNIRCDICRWMKCECGSCGCGYKHKRS